jgi:NAD(P)-dependent dehydrogenase (short-subunit alcohol dehydrogenase family)
VVGVTHLVAPPNSDASFPGMTVTNRAGRTEHFEVFYDRVLGESGRAAGGIVLNRAERDLATIRDWFDVQTDLGQFVVVLGSLPDNACTYREQASDHGPVTLFCDVLTTPRLEALQSCFYVALQLADLTATASGWDAGTAGALSRVLATSLYPRRIAGFATAWVWMEGDRNTAGHGAAPGAETGRAVLFLNYLHYQLGFSWKEIAATRGPTLGAVARRLTGSEDRLDEFRSLLERHYPVGQPMASLVDNPFPLVDEPRPPAREVPAAIDPKRPGVHSRRSERRVCLLTGASGTLGSEICSRLADRYDFAAVHHHRPVSSDVFSIESDLTEEGESERIVAAALDRFGRIDLVVNAAVFSRWGPMLESAPVLDSAPSQFLVNTVVPMRIASAVASLFWHDLVDENRGANRNVINVSSISGQHLFAGEGQSIYAASKAALDHLTGHMALEFATIGVRVNAVAPNSFPSNVPTSRVVRAIEHLDAGGSNGTIVVVDGGADHEIRLLASL